MSDSVNKVSINRIIGNVIGNLGLKGANNIVDDFARWACEAESKIGSTNSYKRFECELTIRNRKAALPPNFSYLNAIKIGGRIIPITKRSFRLFSKGTSLAPTTSTKYINNQLQVTNPGLPLVLSVNFTGAFAVGELINVTVTINNNGTISSKTFNYIVQIGDSLTLIGLNISDLINAIPNLGYFGIPANDSLQISGSSSAYTFTVSLYTDSIAGIVTQSVIQNRIKPTTTSTSDSCEADCNVPTKTGSVNLASGNIAKLNTGLFANDNFDGITESAFSIDNGCINFNALDDTRFGISYMGVELDEEGWPLIAESHEDAVTHYLMYMYKGIDYYNGKIANHVFNELKMRWFDLCGQARGDDELPNAEEMKYLANMWMQLIPPMDKDTF